MYISENHKKQGDFKMTDYAPGMRAVIRDEEWLIKRIETNSLGHQVLHCVGVTPLVKDRDAIFLTDLEQIQIVDPASIQLIADSSPFFKRSLLYLESQWRQQLPTDTICILATKRLWIPCHTNWILQNFLCSVPASAS